MNFRKNLNNILAGTAIGLSALVSGCNSNCPSCDGTLYTQSNPLAQLMNTQPGIDNYKLGTEDSHVPVQQCGFVYEENHEGGFGDTLEMRGCDGNVWLKYAWNSMNAVAVKEGWQGATDKGLRLGDSFEKFKQLYPDAQQNPIYYNTQQKDNWISGCLRVNVSEGNINMMEVSDIPNRDKMSPIGPRSWW